MLINPPEHWNENNLGEPPAHPYANFEKQNKTREKNKKIKKIKSKPLYKPLGRETVFFSFGLILGFIRNKDMNYKIWMLR